MIQSIYTDTVMPHLKRILRLGQEGDPEDASMPFNEDLGAEERSRFLGEIMPVAEPFGDVFIPDNAIQELASGLWALSVSSKFPRTFRGGLPFGRPITSTDFC